MSVNFISKELTSSLQSIFNYQGRKAEDSASEVALSGEFLLQNSASVKAQNLYSIFTSSNLFFKKVFISNSVGLIPCE